MIDTVRIRQLVSESIEEVIRHCRKIHETPELSGMEKETSAYVLKALQQIGIEDIRTGIRHYCDYLWQRAWEICWAKGGLQSIPSARLPVQSLGFSQFRMSRVWDSHDSKCPVFGVQFTH